RAPGPVPQPAIARCRVGAGLRGGEHGGLGLGGRKGQLSLRDDVLHLAHEEWRIERAGPARGPWAVLERRPGKGEQGEQDHFCFFPCGFLPGASFGSGFGAGACACPGTNGGSDASSSRSFASRTTSRSLGCSFATRSSCCFASALPSSRARRASWESPRAG